MILNLFFNLPCTNNKNKQPHKIQEINQMGTHSKESSTSTSVLASISPAPLSEVAWPVLIGTTFFSCFIFQPSTLSFQATLPNPDEPNSLAGSTTLILAAWKFQYLRQLGMGTLTYHVNTKFLFVKLIDIRHIRKKMHTFSASNSRRCHRKPLR